MAAIYARVSSDRQRREQTIQSQTAALRELAAERGLLVPEDLVFEDEGVSGAVLRRPELERLRDLAVEGRFEVLLCHAPDRLARRYAYQVLLLEEFQRAGIEVIFAKEPERSGTPEDELLRQFQGMIAEYERAQIAERCRRGKLHRARAGAVSVMARAPYGYRYVKRSEHADAFFEIDETEAPVVREIFRRYLEDGESIAKIARWLSAQGVPTRTGKTGWNNATIWGMLRNPAYAGQAAYGKTHATGAPVRATRQARQRGQRSARVSREYVERRGVEADRGTRARERRAVRARRSSGWSATGASRRATPAPVAAAGDPRLPRLRLRVLPLLDPQQEREAARVLPLLGHRRAPPPRRTRLRQPARPPRRDRRARLEPGARTARRPDTDPGRDRPPASDDCARRTLPPGVGTRSSATSPAPRHALRRLLDGYQEQLVTLDELRARTPELRKREATVQAQLDALDAELHDAETYLKLTETLDGFRARLSSSGREPDRRAAPTDHPARRPRGPDRRRRHHDPPLHPGPHPRPATRLSTAFR